MTEPDDLASEVFLGAFRSLATFSGDEGSFRSWLFTIAHRRLVDARRQAARRHQGAPAPRADGAAQDPGATGRTPLPGAGDCDYEMIQRSHLDDNTSEQLLAGASVPGHEPLLSFVEDVHVATSAEASRPSSELVTLFAEGLSTEKGELLVTAASNVTGPAPQAAGLPKWRKKNMIEIALSKLAALGLAAKIGAATGVVALSGTAAAFTGVLPAPVQERVAAVAEQVGIDIPGGKSAEHLPAQTDELEATEVPEVPETPEVPGVPEVPEVPETPEAADFGTGVSDAARSGAPQEDGRQFGEDTSNTARETYQPADQPTADSNPGSSYRPEGAQQPAEQPTADSNPGSSFVPEAGAQQPAGTPTADNNPGTGRP